MQDTQEAGRVENKKKKSFFLIKAVNQIPVNTKYKDQAQKSQRQQKRKEQAGANEKEKKKEERTTKIQKRNDVQTKKNKDSPGHTGGNMRDTGDTGLMLGKWVREKKKKHRLEYPGIN